MTNPLKLINKKNQKKKATQKEAATNWRHDVFACNKKNEDILLEKNISYGADKLQKYDMIVDKNAIGSMPVVFYVHGGAWCGGDKKSYTAFCKEVAKRGYCVVNINYRLMPKVSITTCVADCLMAIRHFKSNCKEILSGRQTNCEIDFDCIFMIGDSAGAHIVSLIAARQTARKTKPVLSIKALGLYYGVFHFEGIDHDPSPIMTNLDAYWKRIYPSTTKLYKGISTTTYITQSFPPTFMTSGEIDKFHLQSEILHRLLKYNNVDVEYLSFAKQRRDARHGFLNASHLKSAKESFDKLIKFFYKRKEQDDHKK